MNFAPFPDASIHLKNKRVSDRDAERQARAARELLDRFARQPGVILADEVGMGKTFVALAVAASIVMDRDDTGPVVVMTPPSLRDKWPKDWDVFQSHCFAPELRERYRAASAESGVEFLRLLDDLPERRVQVIFLTHGALHRAIGDGFAKLAVLKRAFNGPLVACRSAPPLWPVRGQHPAHGLGRALGAGAPGRSARAAL
jgi:hypothetical protein